ncbi:Cytoplasmic 60S subunit biogenesis factor [Zancudomyces culisetae]|uniref:Cytoplasmic 60S subunit biogenesis factor n=1 Tax=Zancudomyces culisetae TaxID=1213189 RepID=A0A1R1PK90_ZANCU|nr:Cytoplasmic 60S subunit biogenesis factor [Zancudomyces culisetae]OMH81391.1 Cytoplasmic 60S subunit biogenesis factor [Zancudomyces culisetae]|eukprot:OMH80393.1 Cytoplasmic 60S subunit biogenesis factor [Zancudomyces culisetae]
MGDSATLFTCISCQVAFHSPEQQRQHYQTDWHRYNLKRKVVQLPPVSAEAFAQRVLAQQAKELEELEKATRKNKNKNKQLGIPSNGYFAACQVCNNRKYYSENMFTDHLRSKKHLTAEQEMLRKMQREEERLAMMEVVEGGEKVENEGGVNAGVVGDMESKKKNQESVGGEEMDDKEFPDSEEEEEEGEEGEQTETTQKLTTTNGGGDKQSLQANNNEKNNNSSTLSEKEFLAQEIRKHQIQEKEINRQLDNAKSEAEILALIEKKMAVARRLTLEDCLFCDVRSSGGLEKNMEHMRSEHSFFIPDIEYLVDLEGLIEYLGEKITVANVCLYCNGNSNRGKGGGSKRSLEAVRKHMDDMGHCKIAYDEEVDIMEVSDFYDFSSSYPDYLGNSQGEEGVEDEDYDIYETSAANRAIPAASMLREEDGELVLPSGVRIGHRALHRYYKQNLTASNQDEDGEDQDDRQVRGRRNRRTVAGSAQVGVDEDGNQVTVYSSNPLPLSSSGSYLVPVAGTRDTNSKDLVLSLPNGKVHWRDNKTFKESRRQNDFRARIAYKANKLQRFFRIQNPI